MAYSSNDFLGIVKLWESLFADYHRHAKDGLSREFDVVKNFTRVIEEKFPEFEYKEIIQNNRAKSNIIRKKSYYTLTYQQIKLKNIALSIKFSKLISIFFFNPLIFLL